MTSIPEFLITSFPEETYTPTLSAEKHEEYRLNGIVQVDKITTDKEINWLRDVYDALFAQEFAGGHLLHDVLSRIDQQGKQRVSQLIFPEVAFPLLKKTLFWRNSRRLAAELLSVEEGSLECWGNMVRKAPFDSKDFPWHQDEAYWDPKYEYVAVGCWMPLDPATEESGCLSFIPGIPNEGIVEHDFCAGDPMVAAIVAANPPSERAVILPAVVGSVTFIHPRTLHKSGPNRSATTRRAYLNEWQLPPTPRRVVDRRPWYLVREELWQRHAK